MTSSVDVAVIDYGMGNLHSVAKALQRVAPQASVWVGDDHDTIRNAKRVVYPGVGAIRDCVGEVKRRGLDDVIRDVAAQKPLLAICVGMQGLMQHSSENGGVDCLNVFPSKVELFSDTFTSLANNDAAFISVKESLKVPHMGWNNVKQEVDHPLWQGIENNARFYFVHSYYVAATANPLTVGIANYGVDIVAAMARDNIFAVQFHPEKSHSDGLQLLKNFMRWDGQP